MALDIDNLDGELVRDPNCAKAKFCKWDRTVSGVGDENERVIVQYLDDMRVGRNVPPKAPKGKRSYNRLLNLKTRLKRICELLKSNEDFSLIAPPTSEGRRALERSAASLFEKMEEGTVRTVGGDRFLSTRDYMKDFKAFWHWYMTMMKREREVSVVDITEYLTVRHNRKPKFVFFGEPGGMNVEEGFRKLFDHAKYDYKTLLAFLFDSGVRAPTELVNVKRKDITPISGTPYFQLAIRPETSKTFGRNFKLMFCHEQLRAHLAEHDFAPDDFVFPICPKVVNQYLKRLGERVLKKPGITMYDFRHNSVCYFLPRYKNQNALMYRLGWKKAEMIHYYSEFLGMRDTLNADDFLVDVTKTELENQLSSEKKMRIQLDDEVQSLRSELSRINSFMNALTENDEVVEALAKVAKRRSLTLPKETQPV